MIKNKFIHCAIIAESGKFVIVIPGGSLPLSVHHEDGQVVRSSGDLHRVLTASKLSSFTVMDVAVALTIISVDG